MADNVAQLRTALEECPSDHYDQPSFINNFAISLQERFVQQGILSDLEEDITLHRTALALRPHGHPDRSITRNQLGLSLQHRFEERGVLSDLDEAIALHQAALALRPLGHSDRFSSLNNLAISLQGRFERQGVLSDLNEAIDLHRAGEWAEHSAVRRQESHVSHYRATKSKFYAASYLGRLETHFDPSALSTRLPVMLET